MSERRGLTRTGFCRFPAATATETSHRWCRDHGFTCDCECHTSDEAAARLDAAAEALAAGYLTSQQAESDVTSGEGQGT